MALSITNNIASLVAQQNLNNANNSLNTSLQRLSSGLKINSGADSPAGLVISNEQGAQIAGLQSAIDNTNQAVSLVQTGEGALSTVNSLLTQIRGLALSAANAAVNDPTALAADQAQIQNALQTIDRISSNTQFGTKKLLDGSSAAVATLGTTGASNIASVSGGSSTAAGTYQIAVTQQGAKAELAGSNAFAAATNTATTTTGKRYPGKLPPISSTLTQTGTYGVTITQQGVKGSVAAGAAGATSTGAGTLSISGGALTGTVTVTLANTDTLAATVTNIQTQLDANAAGAGHYVVAQNAGVISITAAGFGAESAPLSVTASNAVAAAATGFSNAAPTVGTQGVAVQAQISGGNLTSPITVTGSTATGDVINVTSGISSIAQGLNFTVASSGNTTAAIGATGSVAITGTSSLTLGSGSNATTINLNAQNSGTLGALVTTINAASSTTGVTASQNTGGTNLVLTNNAFGGSNFAFSATGASSGVVTNQAFTQNAQTLQANVYDSTGAQLGGTITATGVNGDTIVANGSAFGNANGLSFQLSSNNTTNLTTGVTTHTTAAAPSAGQFTASVTLKDALVFQIGANANQTASLSIQSTASNDLGLNVSGLNNANTNSLSKIDVTTANGAQDALNVVDQAINDVSTISANLGSFQTNTLQATASNLQTALTNTTSAQSVIRDTDFAAETANFTKDQVLVQAGTTVLANANATAQLVLNLLK